MSRKPFYVTTPIYYATDKPHIGHAYCTIAADAVARFRRLTGHDVFFLTGTDEHGQKMERAAQRAGVEPLELASRTAPRYQQLWEQLEISHDRFIRTTEPAHREAVLEMFRRIEQRGDIYPGKYEGLYCAECENYVTGDNDGRCPDHDIELERIEEQGLFFRLSAYQQKLVDHYESHPEALQPESRRNEVLSFLREGLKDLSITRSSTGWGIPVPAHDGLVLYVWVDALSNYLTGIGFPGNQQQFERFWPADVHLVGKDILRFHAVIWPALLMSAGLKLPRQVFGHGWWLQSGGKISKSRGGVVEVEPLIEALGADAVRYFVLREVPLGLDGSYSDEALVGRYNADLANDYGNLVSRTLKMIQRYRDSVVPEPGQRDAALAECAEQAVHGWRHNFERLAFSRGLESLWELCRAANRYVDEHAPWKLASDPEQTRQLDSVLWHAAEVCRLLSVALEPVMPGSAARVLEWLGQATPRGEHDLEWDRLAAGTRIAEFEPLFPRAKPDAIRRSSQEAVTGKRAASEEPGIDNLVAIEDVMRVKLRTARVVEAEAVPKSRKLLKLQVELGDGERRQIVAGIANSYQPQELVGRTIVVVANLKPAKLMGLESQGMLLAASLGERSVLLGVDQEVPPGAEIR